jgi:hypothetical protein
MEDEMGEMCRTNEGDEKCGQNCCPETGKT